MNTLTSQNIKEHYDIHVPGAIGDAYEADRWFRNAETTAGYDMTRKSILHTLKNAEFTSCFELGPGAGTWTQLLHEHAPDATMHILDISAKMLDMAKAKMRDTRANIRYILSDFMEFAPVQQYDLFFSSRALEYFTDKKAVIEKITSLIKKDGSGVIVTKYPRYWALRLRGKKVTEMHKHQVSPRVLRTLLTQAGCSDVRIKPAVLTFPIFRSAFLHRALYAAIGWMPFWFIHAPFCESYIVQFTKKHDH